jgi:hypothetical protein
VHQRIGFNNGIDATIQAVVGALKGTDYIKAEQSAGGEG